MAHELITGEKKVLVTGATGFIGGRVVERLNLAGSSRQIRVLVRNPSRIGRIARFAGIQYIQGDILDADRVAEAANGCESIFHCAYGNAGPPDHQKRVTVEGTRHVCEAALRGGSRLVYLSTVSVYGADPPSNVDENSSFCMSGDTYTKSKIEAEKLVLRYIKNHSLNAIILRPAVVYGPFAPVWTINPIIRLKEKNLLLIDDGQGLCNHLYVDNLVDAMFLAAWSEGGLGSVYVVSDGNPVTWREFFGHYKKMLNEQGIDNEWISMSRKELHALAKRRYSLTYNIKGFLTTAITNVSFNQSLHPYGLIVGLKKFTRNILPLRAIQSVDEIRKSYDQSQQEFGRKKLNLDPPEPLLLKLFSSRSVFNTEKIHRELHYRPRVNLEKGMRLIAEWHKALF